MKKNTIVLDGFTVHSACVGSVTAAEFFELNNYTQSSLTSLVQSLVLHDELVVGEEVIGPSSRFPSLFAAFKGALVERATIPIERNREVVRLYELGKEEYSRLGRTALYEDELTDFVQRLFFESALEPTEEVLLEQDPELFPLFKRHSALRARMYNVQASTQQAVYVPCPYRQTFFEATEFQKSIALDLVEEVVRDVRAPAQAALANSVFLRNIDLVTPALMQLVLQESKGSGIFETAAQLRDSKDAADFRALCNEYLTVMDRPNYSLSDGIKLKKSLDKAKARLQEKLGLKKRGKDLTVSLLGLSSNITIPDIDLSRMRPAFAFLYRIINANYSSA